METLLKTITIIILVYFFLFHNSKAADTCTLKVELPLLCVAAVPKPKRRMRAPYTPQNPMNFSWYLGKKWKVHSETYRCCLLG